LPNTSTASHARHLSSQDSYDSKCYTKRQQVQVLGDQVGLRERTLMLEWLV